MNFKKIISLVLVLTMCLSMIPSYAFAGDEEDFGVEGSTGTCEHNYEPVDTTATCTEDGFTTYACAYCDDWYTEEADALGHDYQPVVTEPICTAGGYTTYTCSRCNDSYTGDETAALGHIDEDGNCECDRCGEAMPAETLEPPMLLMSMNRGASLNQANENPCADGHSLPLTHHAAENGNIEYYSCDRCNAMFSDAEGQNVIDSIIVSGQDPFNTPGTGPAFPTDNNCDQLGHDWSDWEYNENGAVRSCNRDDCNETETVELPAASIDYAETPETIVFGGDSVQLAKEATFTFASELTDAQKELFGGWRCDYVVSADKNVAAGTMGFYGQYAAANNGQGISFVNPANVPANTEIALVGAMFDAGFTLDDVHTFVGTFTCGVFDVGNANAGTKLTVELRIWDNNGNQYTLETMEHTFAENSDPVSAGGKTYGTLAEAVDDVADKTEITVDKQTTIGGVEVAAGSTVTVEQSATVENSSATAKEITITNNNESVTAYVVSNGTTTAAITSEVVTFANDANITTGENSAVSDFINLPAVLANAVAQNNIAPSEITGVSLSMSTTALESNNTDNAEVQSVIAAGGKAFEVHPVATLATSNNSVSYEVTDGDLAANARFTFDLELGAGFANKTVKLTHYGTLATEDLGTFTADASGKVTDVTMTRFTPVTAEEANFYRDASDANLWHIANLAGLKEFRDSVNNGETYAGKTVQLDADIDLSLDVDANNQRISWVPIGVNTTNSTPKKGTSSNHFDGTFDGQNHTISNLYINDSNLVGAGLFGIIQDGEIKDLTLNNVSITAKSFIGSVAGFSYSVIDNCDVTGTIQISGNYMQGGIVGQSYANISNCHVNGTSKATSYITATYLENNLEADKVGGIVGHWGDGTVVTISNCSVSNIKISGTRQVGGIVGYFREYCTMSGCSVSDVIINANTPLDYANSKATKIEFGGAIGCYGKNGDGRGSVGVTVQNVDLLVEVEGVKSIAKMGYVSGGIYGQSFDTVPTNIANTGITVSGTNTSQATQSCDNVLVQAPGVTSSPVAKIGETTYMTVSAALAAITESNYASFSLLDASAWPDETPVFVITDQNQAGSFVTTLDTGAKVSGQYTMSGYAEGVTGIKLFCKPGSSIACNSDHPNFMCDTTIYGFGATLTKGAEMAVEADVPLTSNVTLKIFNLGNSAFWGGRRTDYTVNLYLVGCRDAHEICFRAPNTGTGLINITASNCTFNGKSNSATSSLQSKFGGTISISDCSFSDVAVPVNFNDSAAAGQSVTVSRCTFTDCAVSGNTGYDASYCAPIRVVAANSTVTSNLTVTNCTFTYTNGAAANGDVVIGEQRAANKGEGVVSLSMTGTAATVKSHVVHAATADSVVTNETAVTAQEMLQTNNAATAPEAVVTVDQDGDVTAAIDAGYFSAEATADVTIAPTSGSAVSVTFNPAAVSALSDAGALTLSVVKDNDKSNDSTVVVYNVGLVDASGEPVFTSETGTATATVRLPVPDGFTGTVYVHHSGDVIAREVLGDTGAKYVEVTVAHFSEFTITKQPDSIVSFYDSNNVLKYSDDLAAALAAAKSGTTVTLLKDVNVTAQLEASGTFTLDLNGHKIEYTGSDTLASGVVMVLRGADLTIKDSSGTNAGMIKSGTKAYAAVALTKAGETSTANATLTVNSGTLEGYYYAITGNGSRHGTEITIDGGVIRGTCENDNLGIYHPQDGTLTITGGEISGYSSAVELRSGTLNVTGGTFTATATEYSCDSNGSGTTTIGAAIAIAQHTTNKPISASITGGTLEVPENSQAVKLSVSNPQNNTFDNVEVSSNIIPSATVPDGYTWEKGNNDVYTLTKAVASITTGTAPNEVTTYYPTLEAAIAAAQTGDTIVLLTDVEQTSVISLTKSLTLDLNGKKINDQHKYNASWIRVTNDATLTINGTGATVYGRIELGVSANNNGNVVINGGTYIRNNGTVLHINGTCLDSDVTISGATMTSNGDNGIQLNGKGTFVIENSTISGATGVYVKSGELTITGSTITGNKSPVNYTYNGNGANATGDAIIVDSCEYPGGAPKVTIGNGNTISGTKKAVGYYEYDGDNDGDLESAEVTAHSNDLSLSDGYMWIETATPGIYEIGEVVATVTHSGTVTNHASLAAAIAAVPANGTATIKLLDNIDLSTDPLTSGGYAAIAPAGTTVTLDLNGYAVTGGALDVYGTLTIDGPIPDGTSILTPGTITGVKHGVWVNEGGALILNNGDIIAGTGTGVVVDGGRFVMNGGVVAAPSSRALGLQNSAICTINNGKVMSQQDSGVVVSSSTLTVNQSGSNVNYPTIAGLAGGIYNHCGDVTVNGGNIVGTSDQDGTGYGVFILGDGTENSASLTVNGGSIHSNHYFAITGRGNNGEGGTKITIASGTVATDSDDAAAIYHPQNGVLTIGESTCDGTGSHSHPVITGASAIYIKSGTLNVYCGTLTATAQAAEYSYNGNGADSTGDALVVDNCNYPGNTPTVQISGGTFVTAEDGGSGIGAYTGNGKDELAPVTANSDNITLPEGEMWVPGETAGTYVIGKIVAQIGTTPYATLQAALDAAAEQSKTNGEQVTVTLLQNVADGTGLALFGTAANGANVKIDFGEHTYTVAGPAVGSSGTQNQALHFEAGSNVTLYNGTINMTEDATALAGFHIFMQNYGTLTIDTMTIDGTGIAVATYSDPKYQAYPGWYNTEKPQFNYNTAGNSVIRDSTITMTGALGIDDAAALSIEDDAIINVSAIATKGTDERYESATATVAVENGAKFELTGTGAAAAFETLLNANSQSLGTADANGVYTVETLKVAKIGETKFETLAEAFTAVRDNETIVLLSDQDVGNDRIQVDSYSYTFDLNGHTLSSSEEDAIIFRVFNGKTITINGTTANSKLVGSVMIPGNNAVGHIVINGGTYENDKYTPIYANGNCSNTSTITITGATINAKDTNPADSDAETGFGMYIAGPATVTVENTTITAVRTGIEVRAGSLTLTNNNITATAAEFVESPNGNGGTMIGAALAVSQHNTNHPISLTVDGGSYTGYYGLYEHDVQDTTTGGAVAISIADGTFTGTTKAVVIADVDTPTATVPVSASISGGTFSSLVPDAYCADNYIPKTNNNNTYGVELGATITFMNGEDVLETKNVASGDPVTYTGGTTPTKAADASGVYTFDGWTDAADTNATPTVYTNNIPNAGTTDVTYYAHYATAASVARIGEVYYATLAEAFTAVRDNETIVLLSDQDVGNDRIQVDSYSYTFDLNGHTLSSSEEDAIIFRVFNGKTITINGTTANSKLVGSVMIPGNNAVGHIVINGGTYENDKYTPIYANGNCSNTSTITITDATINAKDTNPADSDAETGFGMYIAGPAEVTVSDTTITAVKTGVEIRAGSLTITGGSVTSTATANSFNTSANGNGGTIFGAAIAVSQHNTDKTISLTINGGTYSGPYALYEKDVQNPGSGEAVAITVTSGTFTGAIKAVELADVDTPVSGTTVNPAISGGTFSSPVAPEYCADNYIPKTNNNTYGVELGATIVFKNGDTVLATLYVPQGNAVTYTGATPTKAADEEGVFNWTGWTSSVSDEGPFNKTETLPVATTTDVTYTATFVHADYVAQIGNVKYATLYEAIEAVDASGTIVLLEDAELRTTPITKSFKIESNGRTVTLTGDVTLNSGKTIIVYTDLTLDLAGHTINSIGSGKIQCGEYYHKASTLTIKDSATGGTITGGNYSSAPLTQFGNGSKIVLKDDVAVNGTYLGITSGGGEIVVEGTATVYGGTYGVKNTATGGDVTELTYSAGAITGGTQAAWGPAEVTVGGKTYYGKTVSGLVTKVPADGNEYTIRAYSGDAGLSGTVIQNGQKVVVDLNGQTVGLRDEAKIYEGHLTIKNGTVTNSGERLIQLFASDDETKAAGEYNSLTIEEDATLTTTVVIYPAGYGTSGESNKAYGTKVTIDGKINGTASGGVSINGVAHEGNSVIDVNGTVSNTSGLAIYLAGYGITNINDGAAVTGSTTGVEVRAGTLNVTGGTITGGTGTPNNVGNNSGSATTNAGIAIAQHTTKLPIDVNISGRPVVTGGSALYVVNPQDNTETTNAITVEIEDTPNFVGTTVTNDDRADLTVSGGTFDTEVRVVDCADGLIPITLQSGKYSVGAGWKITFDPANGEDPSVVCVAAGESTDAPTAPTKANFEFAGWSADGTSVVEFPYTPNADVTLTAQWTAAVASITKGDPAVTTYYADLQSAINAAVTASMPSGNEVTVTLLCNVPNGTGLALFKAGKTVGGVTYPSATGANIEIDFGGYTYTVVEPAVGSTGTENQALHFESGNTVTLKNGHINMTDDSTKLAAFNMVMQNYGALTIDGMTIDGTGIAVATYGSNYSAPWGGTTKPQFNYNTAGSSVIRNSTITVPGDLSIDDAANVTFEDDAVINANKIVTKGTDNRYASANPTVAAQTGAQFKLTDSTNAAAFDAVLVAKGQTLGTAENGEYTVKAAWTITFNANDGTGTPATKTQYASKMTATTLTANSFEREGYAFSGWNTAATPTNESTAYADGASVTLSADTTLYAQWTQYVAQIGQDKYTSLEAAFEAAETLSETASGNITIDVLADSEGTGIKVSANKFDADHQLIVNFNHKKYTVTSLTVGSSGTENQCFQLNQDNTITFKNGTLDIAADLYDTNRDPSNPSADKKSSRMIIQNYANLTLDGMTLDGTNLATLRTAYTLSNNNGTVEIKDTTIKARSENGVAFDVCRYASYPAVNVTVTGNSTITGDIELSASNNSAGNGFSLTLTSGTHSGELVMDTGAELATVTKQSSYTETAPAGYAWSAAVEGVQTLIKPVASITTGDPAVTTYYATLQDAINATPDNSETATEIDLLATITPEATIEIPPAKNIILDLNGHNIASTTSGERVGSLMVYGTLTLKDDSGNETKGTISNTNNTDSGAGIIVQSAYNLTVNDVTINGGTTGIALAPGSENAVVIINSGTVTGAQYGVDSHSGTLIVNNGTITATNGNAINVESGTVKISGTPTLTAGANGVQIGITDESIPTVVSTNNSYTRTAGYAWVANDESTTYDQGYHYKAVPAVTVTFNGNDGTVTLDSEPLTVYTQTVPAGIATALTANRFERSGYTFAGWNTVQNPTSENEDTAYADKANVTLTGNLTLYAQWTEDEPASQLDFRRSLSLNSDISLNAYVGRLPDGVDPAAVTATVSLDGKELFTTAPFNTLLHGDLTFDGIKSTYYYIEIAQLAAKRMVDEFVVTVYNGENKIGEKAFSIVEYCMVSIEKGQDVELCEATLHYGSFAQQYFHNKESNLADAGISDPKLTAIPDNYAIGSDPTFASIDSVKMSLSLESKTYLNIYLVPESGHSLDNFTITVTKNGTAYSSVSTEQLSNGWIYVRIYNIAAKELADVFAITVTNNTDSSSATWYRSAVNYLYVNQNDADMVNLMKAAYQYYLSAKATITG